MSMGMSLRLELSLIKECRITKGIRKSLLPHGDPTFDAKVGQPIIVPLRRLLQIGELDGRLVLTEVRRTQRSIYYSAFHPNWGSFEVKQAL